MNSERFAQLASQAREGKKAALEQLLHLAYTTVSYQCRKLLQDDQAAETITKRVLRKIPEQLQILDDTEDFEKWLGAVTAKYCLKALEQRSAEEKTPAKRLYIPGEALDERELAVVVDQILDALPDDLRICMTLYCCCKLSTLSISRCTGFSESAVKTNLSRSQALISGQLQKLSQKGIRFAAVTPIPELLQIAMYTPRDPKGGAVLVNKILGKQAAPPVPRRKRSGNGLKIALALVSVLLILMLGLIFFLEGKRRAALETEAAQITEATTLPAETTASTTVTETTVETTAETTMATTVETTVETTAETTEATTEATTEPAAMPVSQNQQSSTPASGGNAPSAANGGTSSGAAGSSPSGNAGNTSSGGNHVHSYQDAGPIGVNPAGCENPGSRLKICFVCGDQVRYVDEVGLPAHGHSYSTKVKEPTTSREGYTIHTCTRCGKSYTDNYVPKLPEETQAPPAPQPEASPEITPEASPEVSPEAGAEA